MTFIPGPIEFSDNVLKAMSCDSLAHTSPQFIAIFQQVLAKTKKMFKSTKGQPFVLAGSGTLGWDIAGANFVQKDDKVLVLSTGFFSDSFANALKGYSDNVDVLEAKAFGKAVALDDIEAKITNAGYNAITITHTDTSSGVLSDVEAITKLIQKVSPESLVFVDAVCATACEKLHFDDWGVDYVLTASQKAVGVPAGLSISIASPRAMEKALNRPAGGPFFVDVRRWTPIMQAYAEGKGAYFATPPVQLINALNASLDELLETGDIDDRIELHKQASDAFKSKLIDIGLKLVPDLDVAAHGLSVVYYPEGAQAGDFLPKVAAKGYVIAGGIYKDYKDKYFRIGHMGVSAVGARKQELDSLFDVLKEVVAEYK